MAKDSPDSGVVENAVDNSRPSYVEQDSFEDGLEDFPIIGTCLALYTFEGKIKAFQQNVTMELETSDIQIFVLDIRALIKMNFEHLESWRYGIDGVGHLI